MPGNRGVAISLLVTMLVSVVAGCGRTSANGARPTSHNRELATLTATPPSRAVVWGRVPYCNCLADSATDRVADALTAAHLAVSLKEQSPRDGWLYFVVTFDPQNTVDEQVQAAMQAGGAEVLAGPP